MNFRNLLDYRKACHSRKNKTRKRSVFLIFLISYILMLSISMLSNIIYYNRMESKMLENVKRTSLAMLKQLKIDIDNKLEVVNRISNNIVFDKKVEMMLKGDYSPFSHKDIMDDMMAQPKYDYIYDYYIYNKKDSEIITATIRLEAEQFYNTMYSYQGMDFDTWYNDYLSQYHFNTYLPSRQLNAYAGTEVHQVITFIQSIPVNADRNILGQVIILIDQSIINEIIDKINWATEGFVYLIDKKGNIVATSKDAPILPNAIEEKMTLFTDVFNYTKGENDAVVLYDTSEKTGWKYVIVMPESAFLAEINRDKVFVFVLLISCFVLGIILAYIFAYRSYVPIREIKDMVTKKRITENPYCRNEFEYIRSSIIDVLNDHSRLNSIIANQMPGMRSDFLMKLLKGYVKPIDIDSDTLEFMNIQFISDSFIVIMVQINSDSNFFESSNEKEWALAKFVIENVGTEMVESAFMQYFVEIETNMLAFILNFQSNMSTLSLQDKVRDYVSNLAKALLELCELNVVFGISDIHNSVVELRECYDEAIKALNYAVLIGVQNIVFFNELAVKQDYYYYPIEMEVRLMNMLRVGDYPKAEEVIRTLFDINFRSRDTSLDAGRYFIVDILTTFMKIINTMCAKDEETFLSIDSVMDIAESDSNIDIIEKEIIKLASNICIFVQKKYTSPSEKLIIEVEEYIKKNYCENWISLSVIADNFGITPQYLSNLFKKHRGENITDFISKLKVKKAKELLANSDLTIKEISHRLGYANEMGISRIFKKYEGITPGAYREKVKL